jgi:hypothetical protein
MLTKREIINLKLEFEEKIRLGQIFDLRQRLRSLGSKNLPRDEFAVFSNFARRAGAPTWALKLLRPVVRVEPEMQNLVPPATGSEIASYALALAASGALFEAQQLSRDIEHLDAPDILQACAYVSVWNWDYKRAVPFFDRYLNLPQLSAFQRALAQLNLARAHAFLGNWLKVQDILEVILPVSRQMGWNLIERDSRLVLAELEIRKEKWSAAESNLTSAMQLFQSVGLDALEVVKLQGLLKLSQAPDQSHFQEVILPILALARSRQRWEIVRDLDFMSAKILRKPELLDHVYFGTPFFYFRKQMLQECRSYWQPSAQYTWQPMGKNTSLILNLKSGKLLGQNVRPLSNGLSLNLMRLLVSDFYRPFKRGCILAEMYPDQHYDVKNMAHNLGNMLRFMRAAIQQSRLPIEIHHANGCYKLKLVEPMGFEIVDPALRPYDKNTQELKVIKNSLARMRVEWPYQTFTVKQICDLLKLDGRNVRLLLRSSLAAGQLIAIGNTRSRLYRFRSRLETKSDQRSA